ncbi:MAG: deoxyguanosinetriphosphate triphosphohydrolase [candidate division Zixibacteria bacterium]|nr:deoxyguanosinetriphosphate triphosphohydrolase [candidate division Zixibacteria bacterium]
MSSEELNQAERVRFPAGYAALSSDSRGRKFTTRTDPYRTEYQRDRDRIIHSTAFRRLQHKTQVFANLDTEFKPRDHHRSRLTHTIEVAQISRSIARAMGLNEDLAEAVALAHDLGHTPFGHAGEEIIDELMKQHGGFNHNHQSLRVVDFLEKRYPGHYGLNLTYELREAIIKHESTHDLSVPDEFYPEEKPLLEGQIVNLADDIAYGGHDVDDGLSSGFLNLDLIRETDFLSEIIAKAEQSLTEKTDDMIRFAFVRSLVNMQTVDLIAEINLRLEANSIKTIEDVRRATERIVSFSEEQNQFNNKLKTFLRKHMYFHPILNRMKKESFEIISFLFNMYLNDINKIPEGFRRRFPELSPHQLAADYIAGMTDRFAQNEFTRNC